MAASLASEARSHNVPLPPPLRLARLGLWRVLIAGVILVAFSLRVSHLTFQSFWTDESASVYNAAYHLPKLLQNVVTVGEDAPLYFLLMHFWQRLAGSSEFSFRYFSLLCGVLTVSLIWALGRRLGNRLLGLFAALIAALGPYHIWYSQEARQYSLMILLTCLSTYLFLRGVQVTRTQPRPPGWPLLRQVALWLAYTLVTLFALGSHIFAIFIPFFQDLALTLFLFRSRRSLFYWLLAQIGFALVLLTFVSRHWPDIQNNLNRAPPTWGLAPALPVMLRDIWLSFSLYSADPGKWWLASPALALLALASFPLFPAWFKRAGRPAASTNPHPQRLVLFTWLYLSLPLLAFYAAALILHRFTPRYVAMSIPAFDLLLAFGLCLLWKQRPWLAALGLLLLLLGDVTSISRAYTLQEKEDFRSAVQSLEQVLRPSDSVVIDSGWTWETVQYYYHGADRDTIGDTPQPTRWFKLPASGAYQNPAALASQMSPVITTHPRVWFFASQEDPRHIIRGWLDTHAILFHHQVFAANVELLGYDVPRGDLPRNATVLNANYGNALSVLGYQVSPAAVPGAGFEHVTVYTRLTHPTTTNYHAYLSLMDSQGFEWAHPDVILGSYYYSTARWTPGQIVATEFDFPVKPGTPPAPYQASLGIFDPAGNVALQQLAPDGKQLGERVALGTISISPADTLASIVRLAPQHRLRTTFKLALPGSPSAEITLLGADLNEKAPLHPGDELPLTLYWRWQGGIPAPASLLAGRLTFSFSTPSGPRLGEPTYTPLTPVAASLLAGAGDTVAVQYRLQVPAVAPSGRATITVMLDQPAATASTVTLGAVLIAARSHTFVVPLPEISQTARFGDVSELLGTSTIPQSLKPGQQLHLTLYWRSLRAGTTNYIRFVHVLDRQGRIVAGSDTTPVQGTAPTSGWVPGEVLRDEITLDLAPSLPPGLYQIEIGLYLLFPSPLRLPVYDSNGHSLSDRRVLLTSRMDVK